MSHAHGVRRRWARACRVYTTTAYGRVGTTARVREETIGTRREFRLRKNGRNERRGRDGGEGGGGGGRGGGDASPTPFFRDAREWGKCDVNR